MDSYLKGISILGSTGSVGTQTLDVIQPHSEKFQIIGLSANKNHSELLSQIKKHSPKYVSYSGISNQLETVCKDNQVNRKDFSEISESHETDLLVVATT